MGPKYFGDRAKARADSALDHRDSCDLEAYRPLCHKYTLNVT